MCINSVLFPHEPKPPLRRCLIYCVLLISYLQGANCCQQNQFVYEGNCCDMCPQGTYLEKYCGANTKTKCVACQKGTFTDHIHNLNICYPCQNCIGDHSQDEIEKQVKPLESKDELQPISEEQISMTKEIDSEQVDILSTKEQKMKNEGEQERGGELERGSDHERGGEMKRGGELERRGERESESKQERGSNEEREGEWERGELEREKLERLKREREIAREMRRVSRSKGEHGQAGASTESPETSMEQMRRIHKAERRRRRRLTTPKVEEEPSNEEA
ncbi:hypothetical protein chiPu_0016212 [Chiloscyllium punctatum]|uniref:TNFR-Cys domain-containing protein n=1 Tax=Chiloscyllium punctatum TaxID=137246 RepID=A0A401T4V9_CHIPU|nr:hypothetical protein [Chiloscyllium punctatum]